MRKSSTGIYGSTAILNSDHFTDLFTDVETLKETAPTLNTTYLQTTNEHRVDISQNRQDISLNLGKINDINNNKIPTIKQDINDISTNKIPAIKQDINDISNK
jgi:anti-sigma28 factor (negative regulator of flagellin synthesis)